MKMLRMPMVNQALALPRMHFAVFPVVEDKAEHLALSMILHALITTFNVKTAMRPMHWFIREPPYAAEGFAL